MALNLSWTRQFITIDEKPLDWIFPLLCNFCPGIEDSLNKNISSAAFVPHGFSSHSWSRLITSSQSRSRWNPPPFLFVSNNKDSFAGRQHLYFQVGRIFSASKSSTSRPWTIPMFKTLGIYHSTASCNNPLSSHSECFSHCETSIPPKACMSSSFPWRTGLQYQSGKLAGSGRYRTDLSGAITGFHTISINFIGSLIPLPKQIDGFQISSEIHSLYPQIKPRIFSSPDQCVIGSWLGVSPDIRSGAQAQAAPYETETVIWSPFNKEFDQTKIYYIVEKVTIGAEEESYDVNLRSPLLVSEIELKCPMLSDCGYQYSSATPTVNTLFSGAWYSAKSQITSTEPDGKTMSPVSKTNLLSYTITIPFSKPLPTNNPFLSWAYYKPNKIIESSHLCTISLLNTHEASVIKQKWFEVITWPLFYSNIVKPLTYSKMNFKRQWIQSDSDIPQLWTFSKVKPRKYLDTFKADKARLWLQIKNKETEFQKHPKFPFESPRIESREGKIKYWMKARGGAIISLDQTETCTIVPQNRPDPSAVGCCSNSYHTLLRMQRDVKTFTYLEIDMARPLGSPTGNTEHSEKSIPFTVRSRMHAEGVKITHWTKSHTEEKVWFPVQSRGAQHPCDSQVNHYLSELQDEKIRPWYRPQVNTVKTVINTEFPMLPSWIKQEGDQSGLWTQSQDDFAKYWFQIRIKMISQGAQPVSQTEHKWAMLETETDRLWDPPVVDKLRNWIHHGIDTVKTLNDLDVHKIKPQVHKEARTLIKWRQTDLLKIKTQAPYEADIAMSWNHDGKLLVHNWKDFLEDRDTTWINSQLQELNDWAPPKIDRFSRWTKTDTPLSSLLISSEMDTFVQSAVSKSSNINLLIDSIIYAMLLWTKKKPASKSKCTHTILILWMSTKMLPGSLCTQTLRDKYVPWLQDESQETNNWMISESDLTSLWPKTHYPEINSVPFKGETFTIWDPEEYPTPNLWREIEAEITTELTHTESPLGTSCAFQVPNMTVFNQADPPPRIRPLREDYDEITTWLSYKTQPVNPWTPPGRNLASAPHYETSVNNLFSETKYDTDIPWFHTEFFTETSLTGAETVSGVGVNDAETVNMWTQTTDALEKLRTKDKIQIPTSFTEGRMDSFTPWIQMESPTYDKWTLRVSDKITLLTQAMHPTGYQWTESIAPTASVWLKGNPLLVNLWLQKISDRALLPWPQAEYLPLNLQPPAVTYTIIPHLFQAEYAPISLWRKPTSDVIIMPWNQPELFNQKTYLESNTRVLPWPEPEQIPEHLWLLPISDTFISQWPWHESSKINMASAVNPDALIMSIPRWPEKHTPEVNLRSLLVSDRKAAASLWSEYSAGNALVSPMDDRVTSWSQFQALPAYTQAWTVFDMMMQSHTHNKCTLINQWPHIFSGAMTSPWCLDDFQATSMWRQPVSDEFVLSRTPVSSPEVNPWGSVMSDAITVSCSGSEYLLVDRGTLLRYNTIAPAWLQQRLPLDLRMSPISDIITPHWLQKESTDGNLRLWSVSDAVTPTWTQIESPIWGLWALPPPNPGPPNAFPTRNLLPNYSADKITQPWDRTEIPWIHHASITIPPLRQTEFRAENLWTSPLSDTVAPLSTHVGSLPLYLRTLLPSNFITALWTLPEPLPSKLWTSSVLNGLRLSLPQTESKNINAQALFEADPLILPWTQFKHKTLTPWTAKADDMLSQWMASEVLSVQSQIRSAYDPDQSHLQIPAIKHWMHAVPDHAFLRNQASSPAMYFWKKHGIDTFMEWATSQFTNTRRPTETLSTILNHDEISTTDSWTNFETNTVSQMSQANSRILNLWTHSFAHWMQSNFDGVTPWAQTLWAVESPTIHMRSTEPLWKLAHIKVIRSWKQSTTEMALQVITKKSTTVYSFTKFILDNAFIFDHTVSPIGSRQTQTEDDEAIWTQSKSLKKYIQTNPYSKILTKWGQGEFSEDIIWAEPEAGKAMVWQQSKSKSFIPRIGETVNVVKARAETESSVKTYFAKLVPNSLSAQIQANFLAMNADAQLIHDKFVLGTNANYPLTKSWREEGNRAVNTKGISENQPATEIVNLCTDMVYPTFNSLLQRENVATVWSRVEPQQIKFPWQKTKLSNIIHWTQSDSLSIYPCMNNKLSKLMPWTLVQYIPEYHLADSKAIPWSETEPFLAHIWKETTFSKVIYWTQTESLSVTQSTQDSVVTPWIQRGFPQEDMWVGYTAPKINQLIQEDYELESSPTVTLSSIVFTWTHPEHIPLVPWTESMELRYTTINKGVWPSYSPIILAHPESPEVFMPTNSVSETFTPLKWNDFPIKYHWAQPLPDKLIPLTRVLYIPENLWTEVVYSTFVHMTKFISSSEIIPIQPTYYAVTPWAKDKVSEIITCTLSDYHACISWNQSMYVNSIITEASSSVLKKALQTQSSLDFLAPIITTKFTMWRPSELPLLEAELKPIASIIVEWTQAEVSQNLIAETSKTTDTSLNSIIFPPILFYMKAETEKGTFLTVTESEAKKILTVSNINTLIISVHAPTYVIQHSTQIRWTSLLWAPTETLDRNTWSFSEVGSPLSWKVPIPLAASYELHHNPKHWFKTQDERIKPWTQSDFQIIDVSTLPMTNKVESHDRHIVGMHSATDIFDAWSQSKTESVRFWNISKDSTSRPWFQIEAGIDNNQMPLKSTAVKVWPQAESEVFRPWTQNVFNIPLSQDEIEPETYLNMSNINAWFQFQKISTRQRTKFAHETVTPWIWPEWQITHSWNEHEIKVPKTGSHFRTDTSQIFLTYSKSDEIKLWTQPESQLVRRWTEDAIVTLWSLTKNDAIKPWLGLEYETTQAVAQLSDGVIDPSVQCEASTETLPVISWIPFDAVPYSVQTQMESTFQSPTQIHAIRQWSQPEYETTKYLTHSNVGVAYPWVQHEGSTKTLEIIPWTRSDTLIYPLQTQIDYEFQSPTQAYSIRQWSYPKYEITKYLAHPNVPIIKPWIQHEDSTKTQGIIPWTHSDMVISYPLQTQMDSTFQSLTQIYAAKQWSQPKYETTESWRQPGVGMAYPWITHQGSTETLEIFSWAPSNTVISSLQTQIDSTLHYLPQNYAIGQWSQPDYKTTRSTQTNGHEISPLIQPQGSTATLKIVFWTHSDTLSYSIQTLMDSFRFWNQFQPKTPQIWAPTAEQARETPVLTGIGTVTSPFHFQETLSREKPTLMPPPQLGPQDKHLMEPLSFKESILNVSLSGCHLSMVWKDNLQALWLYKTAVLSHETTECGLRPGLVPHCPNCWEAEIGEFPWMVSVQLSYSHFCAGSILNEKWILTSARCANFVKRSEALALVQVGLVDLQDATQGEIVGIHRSMPYLGSSGPLGPGLLLLKEPLQFQPWVLPICLVESLDQERHIQLYDCWLPSWSLMRGSPGILQKRHLSIMQISPCDKFWPQLNEFTFCVEAKKAMGESGCKGDLGAPLVCHLQHKDTWVQMGILIHFDEQCKKPYVFSHVSPFISWLQRVTQPSHAPWSNQEPVTISVSNSVTVFTNRKVSKFTASVESTPHFISLSEPQALGDHISLQYTMPWQALISSCGNQICSGSMINSYWVLTAAHCVRHMNPKDTVVILGFRNPGTTLKIVKVTSILLNEEFRLSNQGVRNDLALVRIQEGQGSVPIVAPLGNIRNLNTSECWLSGPQIVNPGDILENPEVLQIQLMGASNCAYLYPDIGGSTVCYASQARGPEINMESVSPGSTVMCRPISGNGKWIQIGLTSLKHLATIVSPHFSWILSSTAKAGYPLNPDFNPWVENPKSSSLVRRPTTPLFYFGMTLAVMRMFIL
ncbi:uncharacterized protein Tmprss9l1 isoform X2 [Rattus norvegicus]